MKIFAVILIVGFILTVRAFDNSRPPKANVYVCSNDEICARGFYGDGSEKTVFNYKLTR